MARPKLTDAPARDKILATAFDLFLRQGFHQTGVNQIIEEAGVSKANLYTHFPTKDDPAVAYLRDRIEKETDVMLEMVDAIQDPRKALLAYAEILVPHMETTDVCGCGFANVAVEVTDHTSPILRVIHEHDVMYLNHMEKTVRRLIDSEPPHFARLYPKATARSYHLLVEGVLVAARNQRTLWPLHHVIDIVKPGSPESLFFLRPTRTDLSVQ